MATFSSRIFSEKCYNEINKEKDVCMEHKKKVSVYRGFRWFLDNKAITVFGDIIARIEYFFIKQN